MVRSIISAIVCSVIIIIGAVYERHYINSSFTQLNDMLKEIYQKLDDEVANKDDILSAQDFWISKKEKLHFFIPHTEIKEIDLWISECVTYTSENKFEDAKAKIEVVVELCEQIPKNFILRPENIF